MTREMKGICLLFSETCTEGGWWAMQENGFVAEDGHWRYEGLRYLEEGDDFTVYADGGNVLIHRIIHQGTRTGAIPRQVFRGGMPLCDSAIFGKAFLDGFTMAGLLTKLRRPGDRELDLKLLTDPSVTVADLRAIERADQRAYRFSMSGLLCGSLALMTILGSYVCLVVHKHQVIAGLVLGTWVFAIIGDLIWKYLDRRHRWAGKTLAQ